MKNLIGELLVEKLTKEEFSNLCEQWDTGGFDHWMRNTGLEIDSKNFPEKYKWVSNDDEEEEEEALIESFKIPIVIGFGKTN